jgi:hypothetical protein
MLPRCVEASKPRIPDGNPVGSAGPGALITYVRLQVRFKTTFVPWIIQMAECTVNRAVACMDMV